MNLHGDKFEPTFHNVTQGSKEIHPQSVSQGNDPPPNLESSMLEYASVYYECWGGSILGYFVEKVVPKVIFQNWVHEVWEIYDWHYTHVYAY